MNNRILDEWACKTGVSNVKRQQGIDGDQVQQGSSLFLKDGLSILRTKLMNLGYNCPMTVEYSATHTNARYIYT